MIGQIIINQIRAGNGAIAMMSWGFRNPKAFGENVFGDDNFGGVFFQVSGFKFKGKVMVKLMFNDTYRIELGTLRKGVWKCKESVDGVYCDMLTNVIDELVEHDGDQEAYEEKVRNATYKI